MDNGQFKSEIRDSTLAEMEMLKNIIHKKEAELLEVQGKMSLSEFSTTQLKAELRRRKKEKRGYM